MQTAKRIYEVSVWLRLDDDGTASETLAGRTRDQLARLDADILRETKPAKRRLAYPVAKSREGAFVVFDVRMEPSHVGSIIPAFKHNKDIIRISVSEKSESKAEPIGQPARSYVAAPADHRTGPQETGGERPASAERPAVKMEDLEKKLEEILHGESGDIK